MTREYLMRHTADAITEEQFPDTINAAGVDLKLRYRLIPYIYSLAAMVTHEDYTMLRALAFDFRCDPDTYNIDDQYMFGSALLVAPMFTSRAES